MQPTLKEINELLEETAPLALAADFDNSGLQCGDWTQRISRILLCVDCTEQIADEAIKNKCDLILSHHPLILPSISGLCEQDAVQRILRKLIRNDIALVASHTNTDVAKNGLCDVLAKLFDLKNTQVVEPIGTDGDGYGRIGDIKPVTLERLAKDAKEKLSATSVRFTGDGCKTITKLAVLSGSGTSALDACLQKGAQCVVTGDVKYSQGLVYQRVDLSIIDAGHYDTEKVILLPWQNHLQSRLDTLQYQVDLIVSSVGADIFSQV